MAVLVPATFLLIVGSLLVLYREKVQDAVRRLRHGETEYIGGGVEYEIGGGEGQEYDMGGGEGQEYEAGGRDDGDVLDSAESDEDLRVY